VSYERIESSPQDEKFRKAVKEAIDSGINEIVVIAGELGSYGFPELKQSAVQALSRGVRVRVYATEAAPADVVNDIRELGGDIYIGKVRVKDHYLVIDRNTFIISEKEEVGQPSRIGTRRARLYKNNSKDARRIIAFFNDLIHYDFMSRVKEKSRAMKIADLIFNAFIPNYAKLPKEPEIR
jgi:sugar-specific transcriptional regulator TrmB